MSKLLKEIGDDLNFIKGHTLQPKWYKILKIAILLGILAGYWAIFGTSKTIIFFATFLFFSFLVHMVYRIKTHKWQRSWLDFVVAEEEGEVKAKSIGKFYYLAIIINAIISFLFSQLQAT